MVRAHPAFMLGGVAALERLLVRLAGSGSEVDWSQRHTFPGFERFHTFDGAGEARGNRVELLAEAPGSLSWAPGTNPVADSPN